MCLVLQLRMKWMREQLKIKMSDKTKVLPRKKQQNGSTTVVKYLICEFKKTD